MGGAAHFQALYISYILIVGWRPEEHGQDGEFDAASQSGFKCATGPDDMLSFKVGNKRYFRNPPSLHIPQTKHCYTMILNIYLEMIVTALKQQISGKASSGLYWHLEPPGDITLFLK